MEVFTTWQKIVLQHGRKSCPPTRRKTPGVERHLGSRSQGFCFSLPHTIRVEQDQLCLSSMGQQELYLNITSFHPFQYKKQFWLHLKKTQGRRGGKIGVNPPFVRRSGIVRTTPAEVLPLVLTLVPAHKYILVSSSHIVAPGQVGFVEWDRSWCSWIDSWRCNWASFAAFDRSTNCSAFVKPRADLN